MTTRAALWISQTLTDLTADQQARVAAAVDHLLDTHTIPAEVALWRATADAFSARMVLAERLARSLDRQTLTKEQTEWLDAWTQEWRRQTGEAA